MVTILALRLATLLPRADTLWRDLSECCYHPILLSGVRKHNGAGVIPNLHTRHKAGENILLRHWHVLVWHISLCQKDLVGRLSGAYAYP